MIQNYDIIMSSVRVIVRGTPKEELATLAGPNLELLFLSSTRYKFEIKFKMHDILQYYSMHTKR